MEHAQLPAVASISLGTSDGEISYSVDEVVEKVIDKGVTVVAAAGNDAADACRTSPARGKKVGVCCWILNACEGLKGTRWTIFRGIKDYTHVPK